MGSDSSGQFMSGHIRMDYSLPKIFGSEFCIQNIFKLFGLRVILESTFSGPNFFCLLIAWHQNLAKLESRLWHFQPSLLVDFLKFIIVELFPIKSV